MYTGMRFTSSVRLGCLKYFLSSRLGLTGAAATTKHFSRFQSTVIETVGSRLQSATREIFDIKLVESRADLVASHLDARCTAGASHCLSRLGELSKLRSGLILERDAARGKRKILSGQIGTLLKEKRENSAAQVADLKLDVQAAAAAAAALDESRNTIEAEMREIYDSLPNVLDDRVPLGKDELSNVIVSSWGDDFIKNETESMTYAHDEIAHRMGNLLNEPAVLMAGTRFSILTGHLARLERALIQYFLDFHSGRGYEEISIPYMVSASTLKGTGQIPKFKDDLFHLSNHKIGGDEDSYLIPTAEVPVLGTYRNQILSNSTLPIRHVCYSPCFRAEGGSAGRDTRGLIRQHQFHKVELIKVCTPETAESEHIAMVNDVEDILKSLGLPHRRVLLSSGDTGFSARLCFDIEVWFPSQQCYREISSISNCWEFQSKRLGLRYRVGTDTKSEKVYPHTLNGSGVAVGRALAAILENFQYRSNQDTSVGLVDIPIPLRPYVGVDTLKFKL